MLAYFILSNVALSLSFLSNKVENKVTILLCIRSLNYFVMYCIMRFLFLLWYCLIKYLDNII